MNNQAPSLTTRDISKRESKLPLVPLGQIAALKLGKMLDRSKHKSGRKLPYLRNINVRWGTVDTSDLAEMFFKDAAEEDKYSVRPGDVLVCEGGEPGRASVWAGSETELKYQKALHRVRFHQPYDPKLLVYFLEWMASTGRLEEFFTGSTIKHFTRESIVGLPVPNPPLPEQRRIVARIEELFSRLDAGVAALRQAKAQLQRYRQSVLAAAVTGQLTQAWREQHPHTEPAKELLERILKQRRKQWNGKGKYNEAAHPEILSKVIPSSWEYVRLDSLAEAVDPNPKHRNPKYVENGFPFLSTAQFARGAGFDLTTAKSVAEETVLEQERRCDFSTRSIALSRKGTIGKTRFVPSGHRFALLDSLCVINPSPEIDERYLNAALNSNWVQMHINSKVRGVALKQISLGEVRSLPIPLPPLAEQHQIVAEAEARTTAIEHLEAELDLQITRSNRLRQSTLAAAFSGSF